MECEVYIIVGFSEVFLWIDFDLFYLVIVKIRSTNGDFLPISLDEFSNQTPIILYLSS